MPIDARDDIVVVSEGLLGFDDLFEDNNFGPDVDAVEIVSIDIGGGPIAVGAGVATMAFDLGELSVGDVGVAGQNISFDAGTGYDFLSFGAQREATFTYTAADAGGATDTATVTIRVIGLNDQPVAEDDFYGRPGDTPALLLESDVLNANVLDNDTDIDTLDVLSVTAVNGSAFAGGVTLARGDLTMSSTGAFSYAYTGPNLAVGVEFTETFEYTATDSAVIGALSDTATVSIVVTGVNDAPVAVDDVYAVDLGAALADDVTPGTPGQDSDPDGDTFTVETINGAPIVGPVLLPSGAILTIGADGGFDYDQNGAFAGLGVGASTTDSFQYTIDDGQGATDTATATITISNANSAPTAVDDMFTVDEGAPLAGDVTPGTPGQDSDPDGDPLTVDAVNGAAITGPVMLASGATLTIGPDGGFDYDQNGAFAGLAPGATATDSFDYTISDGNGGTDTATAAIFINGAGGGGPEIVNEETDLLVGCRTLVSFNLLDARGVSTAPDPQIVYTVQSVPGPGGAFSFRGAELQAGDTFTQQDVNLGLIVFRHEHNGPPGAFSLGLSVSDPSGALAPAFDFTVNVRAADEVIIGTAGNDALFGGDGDSIIKALTGDDFAYGHGGDDCLIGGAGNDGLFAHGGDDVICGGAGNDQLDGNDGDDRLFGDAGDDLVWGNNGDDVLDGGGGNDGIAGGDGDDIAYGRNGDDMICGNDGDDFLSGGGGDDELSGDNGDDVICGGNGDDRLFAGNGDDMVAGDGGDDFITGDAGDDRLVGGAGDDRVHGGEGRDVLVGNSGDDTLYGDGGIDVLFGGSGDDSLYGGAERDQFRFDVPTSETDRIEDFDLSNDYVRFTNAGLTDFAGLTPLLSQSGHHTEIDFGGGAVLTIAFTRVDDLTAAHFDFFS